MLHISNNIKIIRALSGKTQEQFRLLFTGVSVAMQKSYEGGVAEPGPLYLQELSDLSGVPIKELLNTAVTKKQVNIKVEKVENVSQETKDQPLIAQQETFTGQSLNNLTESNKVLAEANKTLAEANKTLAEANHVISKNHDELIQLTKMIVANSQALPKSPAGVFGPEGNVVSPGFAAVTPSGTQMTTGRSKGKH